MDKFVKKMILFRLLKILPKKLLNNFYLLGGFTIIVGLLETLSISLILPIVNSIFGTKDDFPINIQIVKNFFNQIDFGNLIIFFLIIFLIKNLFLVFFNWYLQQFLAKIKENLSYRFYNNYFAQDYEKFKNFSSSQVIRNIILEVNSFSAIFQNLLNLISEALIIIFILFFLFSYDFKITLSATLLILIVGIIYYVFFKNFLKKLGEQSVSYSKDVIKDIQESHLNFRIIKMLNQISYFSEDFIFKNLKSINAMKMLSFVQSLTRIWLETILILAFVFLIFFFQKDENLLSLNIAKLSFFFVASVKIIPSMNKIINFMQKLKYSNATINIILSEINKFYEPDFKKKINDINFNFRNDINLENISFFYSDKKIINNLSLKIKDSEVILISGPSGVGKSTLVELICGLIKPKDGKVYLGDQNIFNDIIKWQKNIAYIPQKTSLIQDTIENNIAFSSKKRKLKPNKEKIKNLIKLVNLENFVQSLKNKDETIIDENFINISGGQAQRIGIARALYQNPEIIIFDESFNSIDKDIAYKILSNIRQEFKTAKILIISHDLYFEKLVDRTIRLK